MWCITAAASRTCPHTLSDGTADDMIVMCTAASQRHISAWGTVLGHRSKLPGNIVAYSGARFCCMRSWALCGVNVSSDCGFDNLIMRKWRESGECAAVAAMLLAIGGLMWFVGVAALLAAVFASTRDSLRTRGRVCESQYGWKCVNCQNVCVLAEKCCRIGDVVGGD